MSSITPLLFYVLVWYRFNGQTRLRNGLQANAFVIPLMGIPASLHFLVHGQQFVTTLKLGYHKPELETDFKTCVGS